jgi:Holliday junction resolvase RusA-like endonuclease
VIRGEVGFVVRGLPAPKGSLKCVGRNGHHRLIDDSPNVGRWRDEIVAAVGDLPQADRHQPIGVEITSTVPRPQSHLGRGGSLRANAPAFPALGRTGDVDKLARLVLDALQDAHVLDDDSQVVEVLSRKSYPGGHWFGDDVLSVPGVLVRIYPIEE